MTIERHIGFEVGPVRLTLLRKQVEEFPYATEVKDTHISIQPTETVKGDVKILGLAVSSERHPLRALVIGPNTITLKSLREDCPDCLGLNATTVSGPDINSDPIFEGRISWKP